MLCGWLSAEETNSGKQVVGAMLRASRVHAGQSESIWQSANLNIGLMVGKTELSEGESIESAYAPATSADGRFWLWMAGEAFDGGGWIEFADATESRTLTFRQRLLEKLLANGADAIAKLDGEYQVVLWDSRQRELTILNDRFGSLPMYWANSVQGFAFAGAVRGVLMATGISAAPDPEAIREAVSFGGYRLGDRTNVAAVKMVAGASVVTVKHGSPTFRRYWHWRDIPPVAERQMPELIEELHHRWQLAVKRRLAGAKRPGQTLSGGLDSRAILAEAAPQTDTWTAITYGITGCDDAKYARRAAEVVGATWLFHPLYGNDWLEQRTQTIPQNDGLIDLTDSMHLETLPLQAERMDVHLSGYIGDAVSGPTFNEVTDATGVLSKLPYYGTELGLDYSEALAMAEKMVEQLNGASARFALFDHKLPQATNRWCAAWRPWFRVRRPFTDYAFFDFCQGLPANVRGEGNLHERWLRAKYPRCFATIPNQKTGVPILTPNWLLQAERGRRLVWKKTQPVLARIGLPARPRIRNYIADEIYWRTPEARHRIEGAILSPDSISCHVLGREKVTAVVNRWFERGAAPAQVIGAMYVFEAYHRVLPEWLKSASNATIAAP
jgi:Asparagine synthase (glutamine-hydrolyzing)